MSGRIPDMHETGFKYKKEPRCTGLFFVSKYVCIVCLDKLEIGMNDFITIMQETLNYKKSFSLLVMTNLSVVSIY